MFTKNAVVHNGVLDPTRAFDMIGKPFTIEGLASKLREVLERKESRKRAGYVSS